MKSDIEILVKAWKNNTIQGNTREVNQAKAIIESLFGDDYVMRDANEEEMWSKPYFEEVTLPNGTKDYILTSPLLDNGFYYANPAITRLKNSNVTIPATITLADGSSQTRDWPIGEFVHTKFMLLNAAIVDPDASN